MSRIDFFTTLKDETSRIDQANVSKRREQVITGFTQDQSPRAVVDGKAYIVFNSNDYLGLRLHPALQAAEHAASATYGTGPGAVRFISGTLAIHRELEQTIARFHGRDDAIIFSSAFAANLAVLFSLIRGQSQDSRLSSNTLVVSDALNHRSIVDGIRLANFPSEQKQIFKHLDTADLDRILSQHVSKYERVVVVTDGVFSMLGEYQDLAVMRAVVDQWDASYPQGVLLVVDDCHGVGAHGSSGKGTEEVCRTQADVLVGTFGKAFGADGGYVVSSQPVIDYLREAAATYIYSNSISAGTAAAAQAAVKIVQSPEGIKLLEKVADNVAQFKSGLPATGLSLAADSHHPIQPILMGDPARTAKFRQSLWDEGLWVTGISYPVVAKGLDEIRVQISAAHSEEDIARFLEVASRFTS